MKDVISGVGGLPSTTQRDVSSGEAWAGPRLVQIAAATTHKPEALDTPKADRPTAVFASGCLTTDACAFLARLPARQGRAAATADT